MDNEKENIMIGSRLKENVVLPVGSFDYPQFIEPQLILQYSHWVADPLIIRREGYVPELHTNNPYKIIFMLSGSFDEKVNHCCQFAIMHLNNFIDKL